MNTKIKEAQELPEDVELLLPWHAAGTLNRRDAARVEQALANDNELAARYEMVREELGETIRLNETLGAPSARAMQQLFAKIDAEPARKPKASFSLTAWLTDFVTGFSPRTLAYGATAAAFAIVLQAGILAGVFVKEGAGGLRRCVLSPDRKLRRRLLCTDPVQSAGQRRRHHQVPRGPQGLGGRRPVRGDRHVQVARGLDQAVAGRAFRGRQENGRQLGGRLHCPDCAAVTPRPFGSSATGGRCDGPRDPCRLEVDHAVKDIPEPRHRRLRHRGRCCRHQRLGGGVPRRRRRIPHDGTARADDVADAERPEVQGYAEQHRQPLEQG